MEKKLSYFPVIVVWLWMTVFQNALHLIRVKILFVVL